MKMREAVISEIQIIPVKPKNGLVAFASCVINGQLYLGSIAIFTRPDGSDYRLVYPSKTLPTGKQLNLFYPINAATGEAIKTAIIKKYEELKEKVTKGENNGKEDR